MPVLFVYPACPANTANALRYYMKEYDGVQLGCIH